MTRPVQGDGKAAVPGSRNRSRDAEAAGDRPEEALPNRMAGDRLTPGRAFRALDSDASGTLDAGELGVGALPRKVGAYDANRDGKVTRDEFVAARREDMALAHESRLKAEFRQLFPDASRSRKAADPMAEAAYVAMRRDVVRERRAVHEELAWTRAGGGPDGLAVAGTSYEGYDADGNGRVSRLEFSAAFQADRAAAYVQRIVEGAVVDEALQARLRIHADGRRLDRQEILARVPLPDLPGRLEETIAPTEIDPEEDALRPVPGGEPHARRRDWFITQYRGLGNSHEDTPGWDNSNCGPTSLTMVAKAFGVIDPSPREADAAIEKTRKLMGVVVNDREGSSFPNIHLGAERYGLHARTRRDASAKTIAEELDKGRLVIVNVIPSYITGNGRGSGHYGVVTAIEGDKVYMNDPMSKDGPIVITRKQLETAIAQKGTRAMVSISPRD
ncbi:MAG: C39 family peptidase [Candidatus Sericytochromatia bacterium]|nr:C39 family peptidase [Candidatus Tanganyikabacteria bacterium]